jgi:hypothetical protein
MSAVRNVVRGHVRRAGRCATATISFTALSVASDSSRLVPAFPVAPTITTRIQWLYPWQTGCRGGFSGYTARGESIATKGAEMAASTQETGAITGTKDKDYNLIWFTEQCLSNALRLETYIQDAEREGDRELAEFFRRAQHESRKGAERGKEQLRRRLAGS